MMLSKSSDLSPSSNAPGALDRKGAANYLSISTRLLDDLLSAGTIRRIKIGRKTLVRVCDLDAYLAELAEEADA